jgi:hypothetical protein
MTEQPDNWWYSPQCTLLFADVALEHCAHHGITPSGDIQKAIGEGRAGAIFALGLADALSAETWMRLVHPREGAPDIRVMYMDNTGPKGSNKMNVLEVEVTTYTKDSTDSLGDFLFRTKLDPSKHAYSASTVIVGFVQRGCEPTEITAAHEGLERRGARGLCYLVGRLGGAHYQVVQVLPNLRGAQNIDLDRAFTSHQSAVAEVSRGMSSTTTVSETPIPTANPFLPSTK